jgi:hypothetical protein
VFDRVPVDVIDTPFHVVIVAHRVLPESFLPDPSFFASALSFGHLLFDSTGGKVLVGEAVFDLVPTE